MGRRLLLFALGAVLAVAVWWQQGGLAEERAGRPSPLPELADRSQPAARTSAHVVKVLDGDTVVVLLDGVEERVRIFGIDAPERAQPFSSVARRRLIELIEGRTVFLEAIERDRLDRLVARLRTAGPGGETLDVAEVLLSEGLAWHFTRYSKDSSYAAAAAAARRDGRGLWRDEQPQPPWEWRQENPRR